MDVLLLQCGKWIQYSSGRQCTLRHGIPFCQIAVPVVLTGIETVFRDTPSPTVQRLDWRSGFRPFLTFPPI